MYVFNLSYLFFMKNSESKFVCPHCGEVKETEKQLYNHIYHAHQAFDMSVEKSIQYLF